MARPVPACVLVLVIAFTLAPQPRVSGQTWQVPRTSWGHADLQGTWSTATITPLERPADLAGKEFFTEKEAAEYERSTVERTNRDQRASDAAADVSRAYNDFWWDSGTRVVPTRRTALIVDPPGGRVPPLTPEAEKRQAALAEVRKTRGPADHPEDRNLWERCLTRGLPTANRRQSPPGLCAQVNGGVRKPVRPRGAAVGRRSPEVPHRLMRGRVPRTGRPVARDIERRRIPPRGQIPAC